MLWSYGVTTVPQRRHDILPKTLESLRAAGFNQPRLFVDGCKDILGYEQQFNLQVTVRYRKPEQPFMRTHSNWVLTAWELFELEPTADRYVIFQDDMVTYKNLKAYLEAVPYPKQGYCNLYTYPFNVRAFPMVGLTRRRDQGWFKSWPNNGPPYRQRGLGAVCLMFSRPALLMLLTQRHMIERPMDNPARGWQAIDGGIVTAMNKAGWAEYVHNPSLVQHTGVVTTMGEGHENHLEADSFKGEDFDALQLLRGWVD